MTIAGTLGSNILGGISGSSVAPSGTVGHQISGFKHFDILPLYKGLVIPGHDGIVLNRSILAIIKRTADGVLITNEETGEEGYGQTLEEAKADLLTSLYDSLVSYKRQENSLSQHDKNVLRVLTDIITLPS